MLHDMFIAIAVILTASIFAQGLNVSTEPAATVGPDLPAAFGAPAADRS